MSLMDALLDDSEFESRPRQKLSDDEVVEIREKYRNRLAVQKELAAEYGVSQPQISKIVNGIQRKKVA